MPGYGKDHPCVRARRQAPPRPTHGREFAFAPRRHGTSIRPRGGGRWLGRRTVGRPWGTHSLVPAALPTRTSSGNPPRGSVRRSPSDPAGGDHREGCELHLGRRGYRRLGGHLPVRDRSSAERVSRSRYAAVDGSAHRGIIGPAGLSTRTCASKKRVNRSSGRCFR